MTAVQAKAEKITVTIPHDLKEKLTKLKDTLQISMSSIYKDALLAYLAQKEREQWAQAAEKMREHYAADSELKEWIEFEEDFHDHPSS